jgi:hypothetical protein
VRWKVQRRCEVTIHITGFARSIIRTSSDLAPVGERHAILGLSIRCQENIANEYLDLGEPDMESDYSTLRAPYPADLSSQRVAV